MRRVSLNAGGSGDKRFAELNYHMRYEHKEVRDGVMGEGQDLSEEDESRINAVPQDVNEGREKAVLQPQQPQGSVVRWDRFLPVRSLKVLLVESDDSTRHVVSALLRNCSYEVTAVSNGIQAWQILRDLTNHIDLILVEVVMPGLSGIALLCKIMKHKTCKTIPVIMMSSLDSMGIVFKCLSKGAVDFLVKPIRKNELKNLWQHVWRRCHSSSGSGSESATQMQKSINSKCVEESDNDSSSNDADDYVRDGSDNGSGTESSWTRRVVDYGSPQHTLQWDQVVNQTDSTCAQVIHAKSEAYTNTWVPSDAKKECSEGDKKRLENIAMGKDLEVGVPRNVQLEYECEKVCTNVLGTKHDKMPELVIEKDNEQCHEAPLELNCEKSIGKPKAHNGFTTNSTNHGVETIASETPNGLSKFPEFDDNMTSGPKEVPYLELSLNRVRGTGDVGTITHDSRNILRHSDMSAFSRYNIASTNQAPTGNVGSCSPLGNSLEAMKTDSLHNQQSNESSNNNDMGSTTKNILTKPATFNEKSTSTSTEKHINSSAFRPVQNVYICPPLQIMPPKVDDLATKASVTQPSDADQQVQVQHHHHHYHHHVHHVHNMQQQQQQQQQPEPNNEYLSLNIAASGLPCVPTNVLGGPMEGKGGNYSLSGSASGSNNGTSRQNGSSKDVNARGATIHTDIGVTGKSGVEGASGSGSGVDQNQFSQRVAALTKFRQKRKERCFEKKVRYQSRKKLAEQRPRVRGQFVRQRVCEDNGDADS